jgi:CheY-like chemotaxis protein
MQVLYLDLMMPELSGFEVCKLFKESPSVKLVLLLQLLQSAFIKDHGV